MANLKIAILGLDRVGTSVGLALKRYMADGGKHHFEMVGYDYTDANGKTAQKMEAVERTVRRPAEAVVGADIVLMNLSYDEVKDAYELIAPDLRDGVVLLDTSALKRPSIEWAKTLLSDEHHLVGMTPILNPKYIYEPKNSSSEAAEDLFDESAIILTPGVGAIKEAVDLAFNFAQIIGSKPRFLDPLEHDLLLAQTDGLPKLLGVTLFYNLMAQDNWTDLQWFTNPAFGALTRPLFDEHPDALRDEWLGNQDVLVRALDELLLSLQQIRTALAEEDRATIESFANTASQEYETWINHRYRADWDDIAKMPELERKGIMHSLLGGAIADRLSGKKDEDND